MDLREKAITLLSSTVVDMKTAGQNDLFTIPVGKECVITHVIVHSATDTLVRGAGDSDYDFGVGANCDTWLQTVDLNDITATNEFKIIDSPDVVYVLPAAAEVFGVKIIAGCDAVADAIIDVFGYLVDA